MTWIDTHFHAGEYLPDFAAYIRVAEAEGVREHPEWLTIPPSESR